MNVRKSAKGFTLVEMLVVIAIIAILAAALFPAISNAMDSAKATALKNKGRGIWVAVTSTNSEREPLNLSTVWPEDTKDNKITDTSAVAYFNWLLSEGDGTTFPTDSGLQVCGDLARDGLIASGIKPAAPGVAVKAENIAWGIVRKKEAGDTPMEVPFVITKNMKSQSSLKQPKETATTRMTDVLDANVDPFGAKRAVWVTRGGATKDARAIYLTESILMGLGDESTEWEFISDGAGSGSGGGSGN